MFGWLRRHPKKAARLFDRAVEVVSEIGLLLVVFGPLDTIFDPDAEPSTGWTIFGVGVVLVVGALAFEWSLPDDN